MSGQRGVPRGTRRPIAERFWEKVDVRGADECWPWTASTNGRGYGQIGAGGRYGKNVYAHRFAYEQLIAPIPEGMTIDHLCKSPSCVNPAHMEVVTMSENCRRGATRDHECRNGHPRTDESTYFAPGGVRTCLICMRANEHARQQRRRVLVTLAVAIALFGAEAWGAGLPEAIDDAPTPVEVAS